MRNQKSTFSRRNKTIANKSGEPIRDSIPHGVRKSILAMSYEHIRDLRAFQRILYSELRLPFPDASIGRTGKLRSSEMNEIRHIFFFEASCPWHKVYDIIESLFRWIEYSVPYKISEFSEDINQCFLEEGIGWKIVDGKIVSRGDDALESSIERAIDTARKSGRQTAAKRIEDARGALSRRPEADLAGAINHAMGALEAVARDMSGNPKLTLGEIIKKYPSLFPKPLDESLSKIWGYSSNIARHVEEGKEPDREEAELVVGLSSCLVSYINSKNSQHKGIEGSGKEK